MTDPYDIRYAILLNLQHVSLFRIPTIQLKHRKDAHNSFVI
jgi:hypothetical protein